MPFKPHFAWDLLSSEEIENRSVRALQNYLSFLRVNSPYYKKVLKNISIEDISSLEDIALLPVTETKIVEEKKEQFITVEDSIITDSFILNSSLILPMTNSDLDRIAYDTSLFFHSMGFNEKERVAIVLDHNNDYSSAMAIYRGLTAIGANTMRIDTNHTEILKQFNPTVIIGTCISINTILEQCALSALKKLCFLDNGNPPLDYYSSITYNNYDIYTLLYIQQLSSSFGDCYNHRGLHIHPELTVVEILNEKNEPLPDGEEGYLTITPFGITGLPLLRYKTPIKALKESDKCSCGKNSMRIIPSVISNESIIKTKEPKKKIKDSYSEEKSSEELSYTEQVKQILLELNIENFIIEFKGKKESDDLHVHAQVKPADVGKIMGVLRGKLKRTIPVLVSNRPTIQAMKEQCCDDEGYFVDNRL